ncbi:Cse1-domain-containing protein [Rickenella mellea]|uniref:Cse1-domain-containing protein n=1 Tax=Rickenella mellea TaxID=50990 RepID=A0A4Y7Q789_9AGAM|nr:Cse1-domain-containing protein [Rickenella mellea]
MADVRGLLLASLNPQTRKQAERDLQALSLQQGFLVALLQLILDQTQERAVRLSGSVFFKNVVRRRWEDGQDEPPLPETEKAPIRAQLIPCMISLSGTTDKAIRAQMAETVSIIAQFDFPERWTDLMDQMVASLSPDLAAYPTNLSVLESAHSIFGRWRSEIRSDALYSTINFVLSRFVEPFMQIFRHTATTLLSPDLPGTPETLVMAQTQAVLLSIFYDLTCQDCPPAIEDAQAEFFGAEQGWFVQFLTWDPEHMRGDPDDTASSFPTQIKTHIFEIGELYTHRYPELLSASASVEAFVRALWGLLGGGQRSGVAFDGLVSQALRFLSTAIRSGNYKPIFQSKETISGLIEGVVVPNVGLREHEIEQFEDDPLEYIRLDLSLTSSSTSAGGLTAEGTTRRQAAADVLRALVSSGFEADTTELVGAWINQGLQQYTSAVATRSEDAWKSKDVAVYLLTAVATRGATVQHGVTSTNALVDVVKFFSDHVFQDLQAQPGSVHPILQVDAIRFLYTFRNQLTKEQLLSVLPLLLRHLGSTNYVCYSYAAITIERILFIKQGQQLLFAQSDVREIAPDIINAALTKVESGGTPEKIAENDYLMRCIMRVILTARQTLTPGYMRILQRLIAIVGAICKNPSNPYFDQYVFESISAIIRFVVAGNPQTLPQIEEVLFGPLTIIVQQDIEQFIPYAFQIFAQLLELHEKDVPAQYSSMLPALLQPAAWQQKGSIPGLVRLLKAFLKRSSAQLVTTGQFTAILAIVQQKLIPSKLNDGWGFELLQSVFSNIPPAALEQYVKGVITMLLTRLQTSKTDNYVYHLVHFFSFCMAIESNGLTPDFIIGAVEQVQPQLWSQLLANIILPKVPKLVAKSNDRKVATVGLTRMLTRSTLMLTEPTVKEWPDSLAALAIVYGKPQSAVSLQGSDDADVALTVIDFEEQTAGYQAAYSKLAASETAQDDPLAYVADTKEYIAQELGRALQSDQRLGSLVKMSVQTHVKPFLVSLGISG